MVIVISWSCDRLGRVQNDDIKNFLSPEIALNIDCLGPALVDVKVKAWTDSLEHCPRFFSYGASVQGVNEQDETHDWKHSGRTLGYDSVGHPYPEIFENCFIPPPFTSLNYVLLNELIAGAPNHIFVTIN